MEWMNIHVGTVDSEEFMTAEAPDQSTWLLLMRYCCGQENGGRIKNCRNWPERPWLTVCRVDKGQVMRESMLWTWDGDDLLVNFYPEKQEWILQCQRRGGRKGQRILQQKLKGIPTGDPEADPTRKGREGKVKEGKESNGAGETFAAIPSDVEVVTFATEWPGEPASGAPKMDPAWVTAWLARMNARSGAWPANWQRALIAAWRTDFRTWSPHRQTNQTGAGAKNGEKPRTAWELKQRLDALREQERQHPANEDGAAFLGSATDDETAELETIRAELRQLGGVN